MLKGTVRVKLSSLLPSGVAIAAAVSLLSAAVLAAAPTTQTPQDQPAPASATAMSGPQAGSPQAKGTGRMRNYPPPTNLKVLPKNLTGKEVREIMQKWAGSLGVHCGTCHVSDPSHRDAHGHPTLNFADDSKPDKKIARIMYTMTQQMNADYISKAMDLDPDGMGKPVTCGTCHRGHEMPEDFVIPKEERRGAPGGMPGMQRPAGGAPPGGGAPPPAS